MRLSVCECVRERELSTIFGLLLLLYIDRYMHRYVSTVTILIRINYFDIDYVFYKFDLDFVFD